MYFLYNVKYLFNTLKILPQRKDYHPEGDVFTHTAIVWWLCKNNSSLEELQYVALFHDLGKFDTFSLHKKYNWPTAYGHERVSAKYVDILGDIVISGLDFNLVRFLVYRHMGLKQLKHNEDKLKELKRECDEFGEDVWEYLKEFNSYDNMLSFYYEYDDSIVDKIVVEFEKWLNKNVFDRIKNAFQNNKESYKGFLCLIRGVPGSGKTTLAKSLSRSTDPILSADNYMVDESGNYSFDKTRLTEVHRKCLEETSDCMHLGLKRIFVANTFSRLWEMMSYFKIADRYNYQVFSLVSENVHGCSSVHSISSKKISEIKRRFQIRL